MNRLYLLTNQTNYAQWAFNLADRLLTEQNVEPGDEVLGSFHALPTANAGAYLEGLLESLTLATKLLEKEREAFYRYRCTIALRWVLGLQYHQDSAVGLKNPQRAVGAIRTSLTDAQLRIDFTPHALSAFLKATPLYP